MTNEYESLAKMIMSTPQGGKIINGLDKLNGLVSTKEGQELLTMISNGGSDAIKDAARAAVDGDQDRAKAMVTTLLSSKEGAALAAKIMEILG